MARKKITAKEITAYLLRDGEITHQSIRGHNTYIIVKSHGHKYWIEDPWGNKPRITQLADDPDASNVSKS